MNLFRLSILIFFLSITTSSSWAKGGYIYEYAGDVKVTVAGGSPRLASDSLPLNDNSVITTGDMSRAVLKFEDGQLVVLRSNTTFQIKKYAFNADQAEKSSIFFSLFKGGLRAVTGLIGKHNKQAFKITTPTATIGIRGTDFMLQTEGKAMFGQVTEGAMTMLTANSREVFTAGQSSFVPSSSASPVVTTAPPLTFIQLQVIAAPPPTPAPAPKPGTKTPPPSAQTLSALAKGIKIPGVKPADLATAMIHVGNKAAVVTVGMINFDPQAAASITKAAVMAVPRDAAAITAAAVTTAPTLAAAITAAAVTAAPAQAAAITAAAVTAAPTLAAAITTAAITAAPTQAEAITTAAVTAAPTQAEAITSAAVTAAPNLATEIINAVESVLPPAPAPAPAPETTVPPPSGGTVSPN